MILGQNSLVTRLHLSAPGITIASAVSASDDRHNAAKVRKAEHGSEYVYFKSAFGIGS